MIRLVTFDLDDTLWACAPVILRAECVMHEWFSANYPEISSVYSIDDLREKRRLLMESNPGLRHDMTRVRHASLLELADEFDYPQSLADEGVALFMEHRSRVELFAGVQPMLERLAAYYQLGTISNGNAELDRIGIHSLFDVVVTSAEAGVPKPNSGIFEHTLKLAEVPAHAAVHVGDDAVNDIVGAANAGMRTVWYNPALQPWPGGRVPDAVIQSFEELPAILTNWNSACRKQASA